MSELRVENFGALEVGADVLSAFVSAGLVSPVVTIIDRAIIHNTSGKVTLRNSLQGGFKMLLLSPHRFFVLPEYLIVMGVYFGTYVAANVTQSYFDSRKRSAEPYKFVSTSSTNMFLCTAKDARFAQMFGVPQPSGVPYTTLALFVTRDSLTILASFTIPRMLTKYITETFETEFYKTRSAVQLVCPPAIQFFSTPLHLLAFDIHNRRNATPVERFRKVKELYLPSTFLRVFRILPAFGIGGVTNTSMRERTQKWCNEYRAANKK